MATLCGWFCEHQRCVDQTSNDHSNLEPYSTCNILFSIMQFCHSFFGTESVAYCFACCRDFENEVETSLN